MISLQYFMGLGPNPPKIPQNSGKQIRITEGMYSPVSKKSEKAGHCTEEKLHNLSFRGEFTTSSAQMFDFIYRT